MIQQHPIQNQMQASEQAANLSIGINQAPTPAGSNQSAEPVLMHTQSQPFQINSPNNTALPVPQAIQDMSNENVISSEACTCDSVLSRIIYGFKYYQKITQCLNLNSPLNQQANPLVSTNSTQQVGQGPLGFSGFNGIQFPQNFMNLPTQH